MNSVYIIYILVVIVAAFLLKSIKRLGVLVAAIVLPILIYNAVDAPSQRSIDKQIDKLSNIQLRGEDVVDVGRRAVNAVEYIGLKINKKPLKEEIELSSEDKMLGLSLVACAILAYLFGKEVGGSLSLIAIGVYLLGLDLILQPINYLASKTLDVTLNITDKVVGGVLTTLIAAGAIYVVGKHYLPAKLPIFTL